MYYQVISFSHKNCQQSLRENLAFVSLECKKDFLNKLTSFDFIDEAYVVSTCNRVEIVVATKDNFASFHAVIGTLSQKSGMDFYSIKEIANRYDDEEAILHVFSVVSSLDSLVIGESQITGQVKEAFKLSFDNKTAGAKLNKVVSYAIKCAAQIRNMTDISKQPISIASVAVAQAHKIYGDNITGMTAVVIGTGEMSVIAMKHLVRLGCDVTLISRNILKASEISKEIEESIKVDSIEHLKKYINRYRLLFTATSSPEPIIKEAMIENPNLNRVWFDMAIPKDIEDMDFENLQLFRIDDLQVISNQNYALKEEQALIARDIVLEYKDSFYHWLRVLSAEPVIKHMRLKVQDSISKELNRAIKKGFIQESMRHNVEKMANQMFNRFLHDPTNLLRETSGDSSGSNTLDAIQKLFNINVAHENVKKYKNEHHFKGYRK